MNFLKNKSPSSPLTYLLRVAVIAAVYFAAARLGLTLTKTVNTVAPLWPAAGVGLAATLIYGWRICPGVAIGYALFGFYLKMPLKLTLWLAFDSSLLAVLPALMLSETDFRPTLSRMKDVLALCVAVSISTALCVTLDTLGLIANGLIGWKQFGRVWFTWLLVNGIGSLIVGCFLLTWSKPRRMNWNLRRAFEAMVILGLTFWFVSLAFFQRTESDIWRSYWIFPTMIWAAIRFGSQGSTAMSLVVCGLTTWATVSGSGPFQENSPAEAMLALQAFIGLLAATTLLLASVVEEQKQTERTLRESQSNMLAAQRVGRFGSWELDLTNADLNANPLRWSDECFRIFGFTPRSVAVTNELFFSRVHPDDHEPIRAAEAEAIKNRGEYSIVHRVILPGRETRYVHAQGKVLTDEHGNLQKLVGTAHDITESCRAEAQVRESEARLRQIIDLIPAYIYARNRAGVFVLANRMMASAFKLQPKDIVGRTFRELNPVIPEHEKYLEEDREVIDSGRLKVIPEDPVTLGDDRKQVFMTVKVPFKLVGSDETCMLGVSLDITDRKKMEEAMRASEERYRLLADNATDMISRHDINGRFLYVSPACRLLLGYEPEELAGQNSYDFIHPDDAATVRLNHGNILDRKDVIVSTYRLRRKDGDYVWVESAARSLSNTQSVKLTESICITRDITERRSLESQLQQSQKMDAIGRLAGGVAHDFNNILTVVTGYVGLTLGDLPDKHPARESLMEIHKAAERATGLTRQLLAFSRRTILETRVVDLNAVVRDSEKMVRRVIGEDIELTAVPAQNLWHVRVDTNQIDQVIVNLAINARDAMPKGGKLTIETGNIVLDEFYARMHPDARPGPYVMLAISDSGIGMPPEVLSQIFEPFFTTKTIGKGTGLGLATVYGIVKQSGGHINVYSEVGGGSTFKIYFPSVTEDVTPKQVSDPDVKNLVPGSETILLVEDEDSVRQFARRVLYDAGYKVLVANGGEEALSVSENFHKPIHLLLTDVVMPQMSGRQVAEKLCAKRPDIKVLYMSGYTDDAVLRHGVLSAESAFLQKPFSAVALSEKVRAVLNG